MPHADTPPAAPTSPPATRPLLTLAAPRRGKPPVHLADLAPADRAAVALEHGLPGYRADQVSRHYFAHFTRDPARMTDLPAAGRAELVGALLPELVTEVRTLEADRGTTRKTLWALHDGARVESVLMRYTERTTLCVSSQAGCGMACPFCATGQLGLTRNLSTAEIVEQVRLAAAASRDGALPGGSTRLTNVVFMGMGEPLLNEDALWAAIGDLNDARGMGLGLRRFTISTAGVVPGIERLAARGTGVGLAISLHTADNALRDALVPLNRRYPLEVLIPAVGRYAAASGRRPTYEVVLIDGVNDADAQARQMVALLRGTLCHVNLIPLNATAGYALRPSAPGRVQRYRDLLVRGGLQATIRESRGADIRAGCGQLRGHPAAEPENGEG